ncbi:MAG TPA: EamA family transporter, partial [Candidatus Nanopelagicaceae bacterium]
RSRTWISLWTVYVVWGSTYFGIAKAVESMPPLLSMGVRFLVASTLILIYLFLKFGRVVLLIPKKEYLTASTLGIGALAVGIGTVAIAEKHIPTGVASLIIAALPLWVVLFRTLSRELIPGLTWIGTLIGFAGVVILVQPGGIEPISTSNSDEVIFYMLLVVIGNFIWAFSTFIAPKLQLPKNLLLFTAIEMVAASIALITAGLIRGERFSEFSQSSFESWFWFGYLVIIGSIIAFTAYLWLVVNAPVSLVATYAYVNPVIAVLLGVLFLDEIITFNYAIGGIIIILGVLVVVTSESRRKREA